MIIINGPSWFGKFDVLFAFIFAIVCLLVAVTSLRIYNIVREKKYKQIGIAFLLISIGNFVYSIFTGAVYMHISSPLMVTLDRFDFAFFIHILLVLVAYTLLLVSLLNIEDKRVSFLLFLFISIIILFSYQYYLKLHITLFLLISFLAYLFYRNYRERRKTSAKVVFISFYFLAIGHLFFIALPWSYWFYVLANILQIIGISLLFAMLVIVKSKEGLLGRAK